MFVVPIPGPTPNFRSVLTSRMLSRSFQREAKRDTWTRPEPIFCRVGQSDSICMLVKSTDQSEGSVHKFGDLQLADFHRAVHFGHLDGSDLSAI